MIPSFHHSTPSPFHHAILTRIVSVSFTAALFIALAQCAVTYPSADAFLTANDEITAEPIEVDSGFTKGYLLWIKQPVDHRNPRKGYFRQRAWLSHKSAEAPMVMVTEGYMAPKNYVTELARIVESNQLIVEHRYFARSVPDSVNWSYLTVEQAARDHHRIIQLFKKYYTGKWITTGISKGGQTAMIHRALFPTDVDITVPYVAPFNLEMEDDRLITFFEQTGTPAQRQRILEFQKEVLRRRDEMLPLFRQAAEEKGYTYRMGLERAFELVVLEYPFSLWQWGGPVDEIPSADATTPELFSHLYRGSDLGYFSDQEWEGIAPFFYQAYKELGYYPYVTTPLKPYLREVKQDTLSNRFMAPEVEGLDFDRQVAHNLLRRLRKADPRMILIVGETDPWGATSLDPAGFDHLLKVVKPGGSHRTRINNLPDSLRRQVIDSLEVWLER